MVIHFLRIVDDPQVPTILRGCRRFLRFSSHAGGRILAWKRKSPKGCCCIQTLRNLVQEEAEKMTVDGRSQDWGRTRKDLCHDKDRLNADN